MKQNQRKKLVEHVSAEETMSFFDAPLSEPFQGHLNE